MKFLFKESVDEMEKKKEKIMLMSLQRRQQQEEAKARKEIETMQRREREQQKEDEKARKKEEQMSRRAQILEQHRLKKAVEEAEREGKTLDRHTADLLFKQQQQAQHQQPTLKMRTTAKSTRQRPKTIHVETSSMDLSEASSLGSRSKKGSSSNLTGLCGKFYLIFFVAFFICGFKFLCFNSKRSRTVKFQLNETRLLSWITRFPSYSRYFLCFYDFLFFVQLIQFLCDCEFYSFFLKFNFFKSIFTNKIFKFRITGRVSK